jgi:hypothetical protein
MWILFGILFLISIISLIHSFYNYVPFFARYRFVNKLIESIKAKKQHTISSSTSQITQYPITTTTVNEGDENDFLTDSNRRKEFVQWLQRDGVFLLHLLNTHAGQPVTMQTLDNLMEIWIKTYEQKARLAERLLRNQFDFSK